MMTKTNAPTDDFQYPKELETAYVSTAEGWDELHVIGDGNYYPMSFLISDDGHVVVEFIGDKPNEKSHIALSELQGIIAEVEKMALETFDSCGEENEVKGTESV